VGGGGKRSLCEDKGCSGDRVQGVRKIARGRRRQKTNKKIRDATAKTEGHAIDQIEKREGTNKKRNKGQVRRECFEGG